jgi:electron transport complex protein RnfB
MAPAAHDWTPARAAAARIHYHDRQKRLDIQHPEASALAARTLANKAPVAAAAQSDAAARRQTIADALARARARRHGQAPSAQAAKAVPDAAGRGTPKH